MAKTQLNVRVDESTALAARERAQQRGMSVNRYIEELVRQDAGETGRTFVEAAADFMKRYESVFAEELADGFGGSARQTDEDLATPPGIGSDLRVGPMARAGRHGVGATTHAPDGPRPSRVATNTLAPDENGPAGAGSEGPR